jgi:HlyD family secretion protein
MNTTRIHAARRRMATGLLLCLLATTTAAATDSVAMALGKIRPQGGLVRVAAPFSLQGPSLVADLSVQAGQQVERGQLLARTHMHRAAEAAVNQAESAVAVSQARLAIVESGLKPAEVAALAAEAARERSDMAEAALLFGRAQRLRAENTISAQELENAQSRWQSASNRVTAAAQRLAAGAEVRAVDVALARAEVTAAEALTARARRELEQTEIRAPFDGEVIAIHAFPGEVASAGLLDLGRTRTMEVLAEVYESDIRHVKLQQKAEVRGDALVSPLPARVIAIGRQVKPNRLMNPDPAAFADNRVIEVTLELTDSDRAAGLSGALVNVRFLP